MDNISEEVIETSTEAITEPTTFKITTTDPETTTMNVLQKWQKLEKITKTFAKSSIKNLMANLMDGTGNLNISTSCRRDVLKLLISLRDIKTWAFSFIDSSGKIIDGMLGGTMATLGEYDQCVSTEAIDDRRGKNHGKVLFTGKYCALDIKPPLPPKKRYYKLNEVVAELKNFSEGGNIINEAAKTAHFFQFLSMRYGICVPSGCQASDIQEVVNSLTKEIYWNATVKRCEVKQDNEYTPLIITVMTVLCFFGFLMLIGTLIEMYHYCADKKITSGLRKATIIQKEFFFQAIVNASVAVDTFFFIGGLLVCYVTVKVISCVHNCNPYLSIWPILGSGPIYYDTIGGFVDDCYKNWWINLLFINNFVNADHLCLPQSWYISCDVQLYIAALTVLLPILRYPKIGLSIAVAGTLASIIGTGAMTYIYDYPPTMLFVHPDHEQRIAYWANAYFKPYSHAGPYCIGLIIGYLLATKPDMKLSLPTRIIGWCCAVACNLAVLYGVYEWNTGRDPELVETMLYSSLHRVVWTLGVAWVVVNCANGQGGVVNYILSWKCWIPLGRLTYAAYLIHPIVQVSAVGNARMKIQTAHYFAVWMYFGHMLITYGSSFATSMLVETPFLQLEKIVLQKFASTPKEQLPDNETEPKVTDNGRNHINGTIENGNSCRL
ncbi:nose resistant to fluoxetine protein 6 [Trichonephila inaurata madagascariensis]|uniref:Nose resistant to fluoxetine protein 6 n=1 Tax=Trichonephila inaurata madagascariensis TaxID=2747483 RepID=A0A8X7C1L1_9ARAC|nr:nose resistant to fluoxetine protein 6 [Trichonephila inaurata madagascariensis]